MAIPPGPPVKQATVVRIYYCTVCGQVYMNLPPDRICLGCHSQGKFKQVDMTCQSVQETYPA
jgi:uncharacterized OB-fold protein